MKRPPLHYAIENGDLDGTKNLLQKGAETTLEASDVWSALYTAAWNGRDEIVDFLIQNGEDVNNPYKEGWTPVHAAAINGHFDCIKLMVIKYKANVNPQETKGGTTPLYHACNQGRYRIAELLIKQGADVNKGKKGGWKPIHASAAKSNAKIMSLLLNTNVIDVNASNEEIKGHTALHLLVSHRSPDEKLIYKLIDAGAIVDKQNAAGQTPLHLAVYFHNLSSVKVLVEKGAKIEIKNKKDRTPLNLAIRYGNKEIAEYLCSKLGVAVPKMSRKTKQKVRTGEKPDKPPMPSKSEQKKLRQLKQNNKSSHHHHHHRSKKDKKKRLRTCINLCTYI